MMTKIMAGFGFMVSLSCYFLFGHQLLISNRDEGLDGLV